MSDLPAKTTKIDTKELSLATQIIDSLSGPWKPKQYHDTYTGEVQKLIRAHEKGKDVVPEEPPAAQGQVIDLMEALQASVRATTSRGSRKTALSNAAAQLAEAAKHQDISKGRKKATPRKSVSASRKSSNRGRSSEESSFAYGVDEEVARAQECLSLSVQTSLPWTPRSSLLFGMPW